MFIVAAAFIGGFLLSEVWTLIRTRDRDSKESVPPGTVGYIGEHKIGIDEYRQVRQFIASRYQRDSLFRDLTSEDEFRIEHLTWDYLSEELTWQKVLKDCRIEITPGELEWVITNFPPQQLLNHPDLMTDGKFDTNKYRQALSNPQNQPFFAQYTRDIYEQLRMQKLQMYVGGGLFVSPRDVDEFMDLANTVVSVTALNFSPKALSEEERNYEPTEEELRRYYNRHKREFQPKEEIRELKFVFFPFTVVPEDTHEAWLKIQNAYQRLRAADPASLEDSFEMVSLSLDDYMPDTVSVAFAGSQFTPSVESVVRRLKPGQFTSPLKTDNGWQIILLDSVRNDTFWIRRVRTRIKPDPNREMIVQEQIREFFEQTASAEFETVAARMHLMLGPTPARVIGKKRLNWGVQIYNPDQLVTWGGEAKLGEIMSLPMRGPYGFYVFKLDRIISEKPPPFEQVKDGIKWRVRQDREKRLCEEMAKMALAEIRSGKQLEEYVAANPNVEFFQSEIQGINDMMARSRRGIEFVGAALALEPGQITGPIKTVWGYFIIRCDNKRSSESQLFPRERYVQDRSQRLFQELWDKITAQPETKDWRFVRNY